MKKIIFILSFLVLGLSFFDVNATTLEYSKIDKQSKIIMPYYLYTEEENPVQFIGVDGLSRYYKVVELDELTYNELITGINNNEAILRTIRENELNLKLYSEGTEEYNNIRTNIEWIKSSIDDINYNQSTTFTLIPDYNNGTEAFQLSGNNIPLTNGSQNNFQEGKYYLVWIKVEQGQDGIYNYHLYKAVRNSSYYGSSSQTSNQASPVENPETGIEHTGLFVAIGILIVVGSVLVIKKNEESY